MSAVYFLVFNIQLASWAVISHPSNSFSSIILVVFCWVFFFVIIVLLEFKKYFIGSQPEEKSISLVEKIKGKSRRCLEAFN